MDPRKQKLWDAFQRRLAELRDDEARCPACLALAQGRSPEDAQEPCAAHYRIRLRVCGDD